MTNEIIINGGKIERTGKYIIEIFIRENTNLIITIFWNNKNKFTLNVNSLILWAIKVLGDKNLAALFRFFFVWQKISCPYGAEGMRF